MSAPITRKRTEKLSISLDLDMAKWLRQQANNRAEMGNVSAALRRILQPKMEKDSGKGASDSLDCEPIILPQRKRTGARRCAPVAER